MRTAGTFLALLGGGVLIVMIYLWSGESVAVLVLSILTLFAAVVLYEWRPWAPETASPLFGRPGREPGTGTWPEAERQPVRGEPTGQLARMDAEDPEAAPSAPDQEPAGDLSGTTWRSRFDVTWNHDSLTGLALGDSTPDTWPWPDIEDVGLALAPAIAEGDLVEERLSLVLRLEAASDAVDQTEVQLMFGADQDPEVVTAEAVEAFRRSWPAHSPLSALTDAERTRRLATALSPTPVSLSRDVRSPELLYQEARRVMLTNRTLRHLTEDSGVDGGLTVLESLFGTHRLARLTEAEVALAYEAAEQQPDQVGYALDDLARNRGYRLAFVGADDGDQLVGLVPAAAARHWDGQPVGSGLVTVALNPRR